MKYVFSLLAFYISLGLVAQGKLILDVVDTFDGLSYEGSVTHFEYGKLLTIRLENGVEVNLEAKEIKRIRYAKQRLKKTSAGQARQTNSDLDSWRKDLQIKEIKRRLRPSVALNINGGKQANQNIFSEENHLFGFSVEGLLNYQIGSWLQLGVGAGFDRFNTRRSESVLSYLGGVKAMLLAEKKVAPIINVTGGYGKPINTEGVDFETAQGGILLHPSLGIRVGRVEETFFTLDLGYRALTTKIERPTFQGIEIRTNRYQRFSFRIGATF